ncbi:MAG: hypothetical protein GSR73_00025 [Desulfurococcales archaeon]|nr:hypothetical protein [Desulfurococcales archaeon]
MSGYDYEWGEEESLPYGIRDRPVYYMCIRCGTIMSREELTQFSEMMCKNCGGRIFVKLRPPPETLKRRKIYAV